MCTWCTYMYAAKTLIHTKIEVLSPSRGFTAVANLNWHSVKLPSKCLFYLWTNASRQRILFAVNLVNSDSWLPKLPKKVTVKDSALNQDIYATSSKAQGNIEEEWVGTFKSQKRVGGEMPAPWIWCKHCDHVITPTAVNLPRPAADGPVNSHERVKCSWDTAPSCWTLGYWLFQGEGKCLQLCTFCWAHQAPNSWSHRWP